ncbi:MAG TPA: hypothetical protein VMW28_08560 [Pelolinea sp.]|nr:hypothetical protein [Pelolinea sp.]
MKKTVAIITLLVTVATVLAVSCQPVSRHTQRATATAYAASYMTSAMEAAENGALALCNIDFSSGGETYIEDVCAASTQIGCKFFTTQIADAWNDLERSYSSDRLGCITGTSRFLEEGRQFGMLVQFWQINLVGTDGWSSSAKNREYWLQVAEENGRWKLNRVMTGDEVEVYLTIDSMAGEE